MLTIPEVARSKRSYHALKFLLMHRLPIRAVKKFCFDMLSRTPTTTVEKSLLVKMVICTSRQEMAEAAGIRRITDRTGRHYWEKFYALTLTTLLTTENMAYHPTIRLKVIQWDIVKKFLLTACATYGVSILTTKRGRYGLAMSGKMK